MLLAVNEYEKEIADLERQREALVEAQGDADTIAELEMELQVLRAIYRRALELMDVGSRAEEVRSGLARRGYGDWTLDNVYAYVYESLVELPETAPGAFVEAIREADLAGALAAD